MHGHTAEGSACSATIPCGPTDRCVGGVCAPRASVGKTCATNADCNAAAPYCDTYPPAACTTGLTFARGATDCTGIAGTDTATTPDAGTPDTSAPATDAAGTVNSASPTDAASGS